MGGGGTQLGDIGVVSGSTATLAGTDRRHQRRAQFNTAADNGTLVLAATNTYAGSTLMQCRA